MRRVNQEERREEVELPPCPVCKRNEIPPPLFYEASIYSEQQVVGLSRCPDCKLFFTRPRLVRHNVSTREADYEQLVEKYRPYVVSGRFHKNSNYEHYLEVTETHLQDGGRRPPYAVLDIGSHCGFFLRYAKERGWKVEGIEPSTPHCRFAREYNGGETIHNGFFDDGFELDASYDVVTMFDVLEHIPDPVALLSAVRKRLRPGGAVLCKVPHIRFYLTWQRIIALAGRLGVVEHFSTYRDEPPEALRNSEFTGFFDLFEHVVHYDTNAVAAIFQAAGFETTHLFPAPPTNPAGHYLNAPRSVTYRLARLFHTLGMKPGPFTHGLLILGSTNALS